MSTHEDFSRGASVEGSSNRSFGLVFTVFFAVVSFYPLRFKHPVKWWAFGLSLGLLAVSLTKPDLLAPANRIWMRFGLLLHSVVSPVIMSVVFFLVITPMAVLFRLLGKDPMRLRFDRGASTYWIRREPPGPAPESMINQF
jgi:hypothetical protein